MQATATETFLVFSVHQNQYAIKTALVQELVHSAKIHPLPFVPDYIEGVVNCHGVPYTVVNALKLDGETDREIEGGTVLVLKRDDDQFALHISNIEVFFEPEEDDIKPNGIRYKKQLIPFFDTDYIEAVLLRDLKADED